MRRLIVNADDFGLTSGINRAIAQAHRSGVVTSATLMANAAAFPEAIEIARELPGLSVGCHLVFVDGAPVSAPSAIPTLVAGHPPAFRNSLVRLAGCAFLGRLQAAEIEAEATAQIRKIQASGVSVSHIDTHKHTHLFPAILQPVLHAAVACGVPAIRNPIEPSRVQGPLFTTLLKRRAQLVLLRSLAGDFRGRVHAAGLRTTDGALGILATGSLTLDVLRSMVDSIPEGTWEFVCHPGYDDAQLRASGTRLIGSRVEELNLLTSDEARRALDDRGIQLISFRDLAKPFVTS